MTDETNNNNDYNNNFIFYNGKVVFFRNNFCRNLLADECEKEIATGGNREGEGDKNKFLKTRKNIRYYSKVSASFCPKSHT